MRDCRLLERYELLLVTLGFGTALALALRLGWFHPATLHAFVVTLVFFLTCWALRERESDRIQKLRYLIGYVFVLWFYLSVGSFVVAMRLPTRDAELLAIDEAMFGVTPAVRMQLLQSFYLTELMSGFYFSYLVYLHAALLCVVFQSVGQAQRFANWIFSVFAIGLAGYLLVPAQGPQLAFPELFETPLVGGPVTALNRWVVQRGSTVYDAFPSLHALISWALLVFDFRGCRRRFVWMVVPSLGIVVSTVYLRYHYMVDLLASVVVLSFCLPVFRHQEQPDVVPRG
ncbi:phosphatase PAP2 family protein [Allorhodopirellula heiligendammensis]|uniref:PAP2 superfamily protein n=1 Tax=Allorhodopirellula heiligendammensis TaxID=2714739 RepID=A0A5C6BIV8_9BACT|nr:phosphatase PAP2 family protein [Allorhodopirellula heiligendammensis]TWU11139.1 PAP2 superfamily protein [Allorhodopirellula heiligendammensis]